MPGAYGALFLTRAGAAPIMPPTLEDTMKLRILSAIVLSLGIAVAGCSSQSGSSADALDLVADQMEELPGDLSRADLRASDLEEIDTTPPPVLDLIAYVDPFIGTQGPGNVIPGPTLPHGMVKLSPDTLEEPGSIDAYDWGTSRIEGFSHTHLEGPGGSQNGYSELLFLPVAGPLNTDLTQVASAYSHDNEEASPGYYRVFLEDPSVSVELTATHRAGFHRYGFPKDFQGHLLFDLGHTRGKSEGGHVEVAAPDLLEGYADYNMHPGLLAALSLIGERVGDRRVFFSARFSAPLGAVSMWNEIQAPTPATLLEGAGLGVAVPVQTSTDTTLEVQVGISYISVEQARANRENEIGDSSFDEVRTAAQLAWNTVLNRIQVEGESEPDKVRFYTSLYHSLLQPVDFTEDGQFWIGFSGEGKVLPAQGFHYYSDDWCIWDTFRTTHPLQILVEPERVPDQMQSAVEAYKDGGWIPKCPWQATGYSRVMIGNHSICVLADAAAKGIHPLENQTAFEGAVKLAEEDDVPDILYGLAGYLNYGTLPSYRTRGYVPLEEDETQAVSMTLEYAYDDWCLARYAEIMGDAAAVQKYDARSQSYRHHWDSETGFMRPRKANGNFLSPFDPVTSPGYCEANAWIYTWFVPQDPAGLIDLFGGEEPFIAKLDQFFDEGRFDPSNEPDFHAPFLYNYAGVPWKTQQRCDGSMASTFSTAPGGLPGNDDAGATSAWFVFYAMGLYPFAPGEPLYTLTTPLFDRVVLYPDPDHPSHAFVIEAAGASSGSRYVQSATVDGVALDSPFLPHSAIESGSTLQFVVGTSPSDWGSR